MRNGEKCGQLTYTRSLKAIQIFSEETRADTEIGSTFFLRKDSFQHPEWDSLPQGYDVFSEIKKGF